MRTFPRLEIHAVDNCSRRCAYCSHAADIAPPHTYQPADYLPWLQKLDAAGFAWDVLSLIGGEPFLHPDLPTFLDAIRPFGRKLEIWTNLFWLDWPAIDRYAPVFERLDILACTLYSAYCGEPGGLETKLRQLASIQERFPRLNVWWVSPSPVREFAAVEFTADPVEVRDPACVFRGCLNLLHDGRMIRCCFVRRILAGDTPVNPNAVENLTYDLGPPVDADDLAEWLSADPLDVCRFCSVAQGWLAMVPHGQRKG